MIIHTYFIKGWEISKRKKVFTSLKDDPAYTRVIKIKTEKGETVELTLHADDKNDLAPYQEEIEEMLEEQAKEMV
jgi:hypothetical protein